MMPMALPNHGDSFLTPWHLYPGLKELRDAKDFENWYAPFKLPRGRSNSTHSLHPSLYSAPLMETQRKSPLYRVKDGALLPGCLTPLGTDPLTRLPHHHSHSHVHTHYHLHPGEQHANTPRSPSSLSLETNWPWRNTHVVPGHEMWLHPRAGLSGHPRHLVSPVEELPPYFPGLYPPSREYQLQQELMMSQGIKIDQGYPLHSVLSREHLTTHHIRPHDRHSRLEPGDESSSASLLHQSELRSFRSPSAKNIAANSLRSSLNKKSELIEIKDDD